jgi:hypothetical protein
VSSTDISSPSRTRPQRTDGKTVARWLRASIDDGLLREAALVAGAILAYFAIRNLTAGAPGEAFANGERMVDLERSLGVAWEDAVQASIVGRDSGHARQLGLHLGPLAGDPLDCGRPLCLAP